MVNNMTGVEIILIIIGVVSMIGSFVFSSLFDKESVQEQGVPLGIQEAMVQKRVEELVDLAVEDAISTRIDHTERELEKISTEKIMAVSRYSENVLDEISKNHEEVMFLYGMLKNKESDIKNTVLDVEAVKKSVRAMQKEELVHGNSREMDEQQEEDMSKKPEINEPQVQSQVSKKLGTVHKEVTGAGHQNHNDKILALCEQGKTDVQIAKELHLGMGEVRLVMDLYNKNKTV